MGHGQKAQYTALSHCWGTLQLLTTTRATVEQRMRGIEWSSLPKTFQDAIHITHSLGIRYLWIDSLCIIQDDDQEWLTESAKMATIYSQSFVTIAATAATNSCEGCYMDRNPQLQARSVTVVKDSSERDPLSYQVFVRRAFDYMVEFNEWTSNAIPDCPLFKRAWCFQERLLATRVLHFLREELIWDCNSVRHCECGSLSNDDNGQKAEYTQLLQSKENLDSTCEQWYDIVANYTRRRLTYHRDVLPALSGIASQIQTPGLGRYLAGLWEHNLISGLLWSSVWVSECHRPPQHLYIAPSFSWASRFGEVRWKAYGNELRNQRLTVLEAKCNVHSQNAWGIVTDGFLRGRGPLVTAVLVPYEGRENADNDSHVGVDLGDQVTTGWIDTIEDAEQYLGKEVVCLALVDLISEDWTTDEEFCWTYFLILVRGQDGAYSRIGISKTLQSPFKDIDDIDIVIR